MSRMRKNVEIMVSSKKSTKSKIIFLQLSRSELNFNKETVENLKQN